MAETDKKAKKPARPAKAQQGEKPAKGKPGKGEQAAKADGKTDGKAAAKPAEAKAAVARAREERLPARLKVQFEQSIRPKLAEQFGYKNRMQIPELDKIVINMGIGEGVADRKKVESAAADLALIAGQKAIITSARKSIATYKVRAGQSIG